MLNKWFGFLYFRVVCTVSEAYSEPCQISEMSLFANICFSKTLCVRWVLKMPLCFLLADFLWHLKASLLFSCLPIDMCFHRVALKRLSFNCYNLLPKCFQVIMMLSFQDLWSCLPFKDISLCFGARLVKIIVCISIGCIALATISNLAVALDWYCSNETVYRWKLIFRK